MVNREPGLAVEEQGEFWLDMSMFDDNSGVLRHKVQGRTLGFSAPAALIETCSNLGSVLGLQFEEVNPL